MKSTPSVCVVVPYYNGSKWIRRAIESIYRQTVAASEVIVVNDGSKNEEKDMLYLLAKEYPFTIIDKKNGGQGSARNAGVSHSTSEFICFLDQDDFYLDDHIYNLVMAIPKKDLRFGFVYGDAVEADGFGNIVRSSMITEHASHPKRNITDLLRNDMFVLPSASIISRKAFDAVGGFDEQFTGYEDDDLFMRIFRKGYTNYFINKSVYVWCIHSDSTSYSIRMLRSRFLYFKKLAGLFPDDRERSRFYFRDCLMPRFGRFFIVDAVKSRINKNNKDELIEILNQYVKLVLKNRSVSYFHKLKLRVLFIFISKFPIPPFFFIRIMLKMPLVRRIISV
ncbi:glycosyltransferase family 2 protein [Gluconobacter wancherniae]|uniref:glycosyltransferase family 2 protein n=1 Tax=Gluconobacter wancherniae TaxID=1307955 RepID=UPI001B8C18E2|nr:glycosyltransferase family A protein [Gluconobacter wancherniae]MBS1088084.1 glycosyltransferase family 2 protein [Gluconobacter wancherniae]